jgi:Flp pilus assembly protein TadD
MTRPRDATDPWRDSLANDFAALGDEAMPMDAHPDEDTWVRFACDELAADDRGRLVDHALACESCAATLRAVTHVRQGAAEIDDAAPRASLTPSYRPYVWLGVAAALVIAVGGAIVLRFGEATRPGGDPIASATPPEQSAPPARAEPQAWARLETAPEVRLPASLAIAVRGTDENREAVLKAFGQAIAHYRAGRFGEAAAVLAPLAARRPDIPEFAFYLGIARLFAGDSSDAVAPLRDARASAVVLHDAHWYEAVALERTGRRQEAKQLLSTLCASSNPYQTRACAALRDGS